MHRPTLEKEPFFFLGDLQPALDLDARQPPVMQVGSLQLPKQQEDDKNPSYIFFCFSSHPKYLFMYSLPGWLVACRRTYILFNGRGRYTE